MAVSCNSLPICEIVNMEVSEIQNYLDGEPQPGTSKDDLQYDSEETISSCDRSSCSLRQFNPKKEDLSMDSDGDIEEEHYQPRVDVMLQKIVRSESLMQQIRSTPHFKRETTGEEQESSDESDDQEAMEQFRLMERISRTRMHSYEAFKRTVMMSRQREDLGEDYIEQINLAHRENKRKGQMRQMTEIDNRRRNLIERIELEKFIRSTYDLSGFGMEEMRRIVGTIADEELRASAREEDSQEAIIEKYCEETRRSDSEDDEELQQMMATSFPLMKGRMQRMRSRLEEYYANEKRFGRKRPRSIPDEELSRRRKECWSEEESREREEDEDADDEDGESDTVEDDEEEHGDVEAVEDKEDVVGQEDLSDKMEHDGEGSEQDHPEEQLRRMEEEGRQEQNSAQDIADEEPQNRHEDAHTAKEKESGEHQQEAESESRTNRHADIPAKELTSVYSNDEDHGNEGDISKANADKYHHNDGAERRTTIELVPELQGQDTEEYTKTGVIINEAEGINSVIDDDEAGYEEWEYALEEGTVIEDDEDVVIYEYESDDYADEDEAIQYFEVQIAKVKPEEGEKEAQQQDAQEVQADIAVNGEELWCEEYQYKNADDERKEDMEQQDQETQEKEEVDEEMKEETEKNMCEKTAAKSKENTGNGDRRCDDEVTFKIRSNDDEEE